MVLSVLWPGLGQIYRGDTSRGFLWMLGTGAAYLCFVVPGIVVHILCVIDAGKAQEAD